MDTKISQITGVGLVTLSGGQRPAVRVQVNPSVVTPMEFFDTTTDVVFVEADLL